MGKCEDSLIQEGSSSITFLQDQLLPQSKALRQRSTICKFWQTVLPISALQTLLKNEWEGVDQVFFLDVAKAGYFCTRQSLAFVDGREGGHPEQPETKSAGLAAATDGKPRRNCWAFQISSALSSL
ncbi:uncharacterized protein LOC131064337 [Cryptomeria japonica]|uniref:uncharacterized protein LOC131064337 n=1 Tax=Cryptomeria japonica TaxID=3369 RepID=UPI0025AC77A1|nr:uncharacterized protein LOC131064337 [Cryptomeria japonica]